MGGTTCRQKNRRRIKGFVIEDSTLQEGGRKKPSFEEKTRFRRDRERSLYRTGISVAVAVRSLDHYSLARSVRSGVFAVLSESLYKGLRSVYNPNLDTHSQKSAIDLFYDRAN